jgi:hypothetical protein
MKTFIMMIILAGVTTGVSAQGLSARTGIEGEGTTGRSILRIESFESIRTLSKEELRSESRFSANSLVERNALSKFALDFSNVEEITLKDGTVMKVDELREKLRVIVIK